MEKIYYNCENFQKDVLVLKEKLNSLNDISVIIPIARGGLTFAHKLGEILNIRNVSSINAISYDGDKKLKNELRSLMWRSAGIVRNEKKLQIALNCVKEMLKLPTGKLIRLRLLTSQMIIQSALKSKESLGAHNITGEF